MPPRLLSLASHSRVKLGAALAVLVIALGAIWLLAPVSRKENPLLATPRLAVERLSAKNLYYNGPARPWLLALRRDLLQPDDLDGSPARVRGFTQAVENPKLFRQLDRQHRFDVLLLCGDPSQYHPLLEHLLETKDWSLRYLDHTSLVFRRDEASSWSVADLQPVRDLLKKATPRARAAFLAQVASKLVAVARPGDGKQLLDEAMQVDPKSAEVWNGLAIYHLSRGAASEALGHVERALQLDKNSLAALATKTQILYATKRFSEAYAVSSTLVEKRGNEPGLLFYHAKIAHEAKAFKAEIAALEKLIAQARQSQLPISGYQLYLAQAYAAANQAKPAVENFAAVLRDPDLPADQRAFAQQTMEQVRSRAGL